MKGTVCVVALNFVLMFWCVSFISSMNVKDNTERNDTEQSQWSEVWSTSQIAGMDQAAGFGGTRLRALGRRRLRYGSLALCSLLTMHCRVTSSALTGGFFIFMLFLAVAVATLANPLRHFEVYLGQWSMNGPGRAFRIVPLLDGIGLAMCVNCIFRAINACTTGAITATYLLESIKDDRLPFTYCRDFNHKAYEPVKRKITYFKWRTLGTQHVDKHKSNTSRFYDNGLRNLTIKRRKLKRTKTTVHTAIIDVCNETYPGPVQAAGLRPSYSLIKVNWRLMAILSGLWLSIWGFMIWERVSHGRLIWNNMPSWLIPIPWMWGVMIIVVAITNLELTTAIQDIFHIGAKEIITGLTDAFEVALYIHSSSIGTELITGKGMNHFAFGHIDPFFNKENVMHSSLVVLLTGLHSTGASMCAVLDSKQPNSTSTFDLQDESTFWIFAMYSKCTSMGRYSHISSTLLFLGLTCSYITVTYVLLKTALHIIFEYRVKFVFIEQIVVAVLIFICAAISMIFTTQGGLVLLECTEAILTGIVTPLIAALELVAMLYVYHSHDFISDANIAMEESTCSGRIGIQWQIIPIITLISLITKVTMFFNTPMTTKFVLLGAIPLLLVILSVPARAVYNIYKFMRPKAQRNN